jgi:hypothetical protein
MMEKTKNVIMLFFTHLPAIQTQPAPAAMRGCEKPPMVSRKRNWGRFSRVFWCARWIQLNTWTQDNDPKIDMTGGESPVFRIRDTFVRIRILGSVLLTNGSGCERGSAPKSSGTFRMQK